MEPLRIIPLGGLGEFGLNMMLIEYGESALAIDCGLMFPGADLLGIDLVVPDVSYLLENNMPFVRRQMENSQKVKAWIYEM